MNTNFKLGTHKQIVFDYLNKGNKITTRTAMINLGIGDLQGTIRDLKESGVPIHSKYISVPTRYGKNATVKEYKLLTEKFIKEHKLLS
jgi:hypothetical protein|tara:strand:+ start:190 stop:453 length:264 start_codon:yes stop_codon:yes gene_type:complete